MRENAVADEADQPTEKNSGGDSDGGKTGGEAAIAGERVRASAGVFGFGLEFALSQNAVFPAIRSLSEKLGLSNYKGRRVAWVAVFGCGRLLWGCGEDRRQKSGSVCSRSAFSQDAMGVNLRAKAIVEARTRV